MAARWPRLTDDQAARAVGRWRDGRSPYSRIRAHAIGLQLDAVVALALDLGLRRAEIFALTVDALHPDNTSVIVWRNGIEWTGTPREVPYTVNARRAVGEWLAFREQLRVEHGRPWVQLWAGPRVGAAMKRDAFHHLLGNYLGAGWTYKRLRDTCAARWLRAGLPIEHARRLLGIDSLDAVLPYAALVTDTTEDAMHRVESRVAAATAGRR